MRLCTLLVLALGVAATPVRRGSGKLGISWPAQEGDASPVNTFFQPGSAVSWWYDWGMGWSNGPLPATPAETQIGGEFVPMIWSAGMLDNLNLQDGFSLVLGFNEPDNGNAAVALTMDPGVAADKWRQMLGQIRAINPSAQFASPAVAGNRDWLRAFYAAICPGGLDGCDVAPQYTAVHSYHTDPNGFIGEVQAFWDEFGLPLIVSEFACANFNGGPPPSQEQVYSFMGQTTQWLDAQPFVYRYSWFGAMRSNSWLYGVTPENKLMDEGGNLTPLGWQYVSGGWK